MSDKEKQSRKFMDLDDVSWKVLVKSMDSRDIDCKIETFPMKSWMRAMSDEKEKHSPRNLRIKAMPVDK